MTPSHIIQRRRAARRRRRIIGFVRLGVFLGAIVLTGLSLAAIGNADESSGAATRPSPSQSASQTQRTASKPRSVNRTTSSSTQKRVSATGSSTRSKAAPSVSLATRSVRAELPLTGAQESAALLLGGALLVLFGQLVQIAGMPARARS